MNAPAKTAKSDAAGADCIPLASQSVNIEISRLGVSICYACAYVRVHVHVWKCVAAGADWIPLASQFVDIEISR